VGWRHRLGLLGGGWVREIEIDSDRMVMVAMVLLALIERKKVVLLGPRSVPRQSFSGPA
jgi:hypothetical protein